MYKSSQQLFHNNPQLEKAPMSFTRRMDKLWYSHTVEYFSVIKKKRKKERIEKNLLIEAINLKFHRKEYILYDSTE